MAGGEEALEAQLKGINKTFNAVTVRGRANVAKATYAFVGGLILLAALKPKKKPAPAK